MSSSNAASGMTPAAANEQIDSGVEQLLTSADGTSAARIQNLSWVHQARLSRLKRDAAGATANYGATSAQAVAAAAAVSAAQTTVAHLALTLRQATTAEPQVAAAGWALHGRVYDASLQPLARHTVFLADEQKRFQSAYGYAYTDSTGYFLIDFPGKAATSAKSAAKASSTAELYVQVADTAANPVYAAQSPIQVAAGSAVYQNVVLAAGEPSLGDPPEAVRTVALPPPSEIDSD